MFWRLPEYSLSSYLDAPVPRLLEFDLDEVEVDLEGFDRELEDLDPEDPADLELSDPADLELSDPEDLEPEDPPDLWSSDLMFEFEFEDLLLVEREPVDLEPADLEGVDREVVDLEEDAEREGVDLLSSMSIEDMPFLPLVLRSEELEPLREFFVLLSVLVVERPPDRLLLDGLLVLEFLDAIWNLLSKNHLRDLLNF
jgi:hypothetical protein